MIDKLTVDRIVETVEILSTFGHKQEPMGLTSTERDEIRDRLRAEGASYVAVFGSHARDEETRTSDVDILVRFADQKTLFDIARIERELGGMLGKPVELVTEQSLSQHIAPRVNDEKEVLLA